MGKKTRLTVVDDGGKPFGVSGRTLADARQELSRYGVSQTTPFRGYCVHIAAADEFLARVEQYEIGTLRGFCVGPGSAMRFPSYKAANNWCERGKGETVVGLFETDNALAILSAEVID